MPEIEPSKLHYIIRVFMDMNQLVILLLRLEAI